MLTLRKKLTPAEEGARQLEILTEIERQKTERQEHERRLTRDNAARRQQLWASRAQAAEDKRMARAAKDLAAKREREAHQREQQAVRNEAKMTEYQAAKARVDELDQQIGPLRNRGADLTPLEAAELVGLRELRQGADARLLAAERAIGRHRAGRA